MREYRSADGERRVWYEPDEIEAIMSDELRKAGLLPTADNPVVDVEAFIEQHLKADLDQYAELEEDVLGLTEFPAAMRPRVRINRTLTTQACDEEQSPGLFGRWRSTLAHEGAHVVLHRSLFELSDFQTSFFPSQRADAPKLLRCLRACYEPCGRTAIWWPAARASRPNR